MIRTFMLDRTASDNFLLDGVEMDEESIALAMMMTVEEYNITAPILCEGYTEETFPYRMPYLIGVAAFLLRSKGLNLARNSLPYTSTTGTAVDDSTAKSRLYLELGEKYLEEFKEKIRPIKQNKNINEGYGCVSGPSRYSSW
jgi:hypothetical protein